MNETASLYSQLESLKINFKGKNVKTCGIDFAKLT